MPLLLEIVTPDKKVFSDEVDAVTLPTPDGEIGILPGHIPLLSMLNPGELKYRKADEQTSLAIDKGFVEVLGNKVAILTEGAIEIEAIDLEAAEDARQRAQKALEEARRRDEDPALIEELETRARFAVIQDLVKKKKK